jgi:hypothetical protein
MAKGAQVRFRKQELTRAIRAVTEGGQQVSAVHIDRDGEVTLEVEKRPADKTETVVNA